MRAFAASAAVLLLLLAYVAVAFFIFVQFRYWLPLVFPVAGAMLVEHVGLVTYRVVFEEREQRRVKSVFSKIVSPDVMNELLQAEKLSLGGTRRELTVFFADVRGFTTLTDEMQERVAEFVRERRLDSATAEACFDESARETLNTVNLYLAVVADAVKTHGGTLDKYIGDCVMAFWGAPTPNEKHALACVRAAIEAQCAIHELNQKRIAENSQREIENRARLSAGLPPKPPLRALQLGTGINTGLVTVGLMGSDVHQYNYTVFGREVNLASRLESVSGSGHIIISDTTYNHLLREDPALASTCVEMFPVTVKGIRAAVRIYEVPWQTPQAE
jgi:adenylate cyclase